MTGMGRLIYLAACGAMLSAAAAQSQPEIPTRLPPWLGNRTELLPPVDEATRAKVQELRQIMRESCPEPVSKPPPAYFTAARELVEYGEKVGQAMVWDYLIEPEAIDPVKLGTGDRDASIAVLVSRNGQHKQELLMLLRDDPSLAQWLLPLLRVRIEWFEHSIKEGKTNEVISPSEIGGIQAYLYVHGEKSDLEAIYDIVDRLRAIGFEPRIFARHPTLESQAAEIAEARRIHKLHARPYYQRMILLLRSFGVEVPEPETSKGNGPPGDSSASKRGASVENKSRVLEAPAGSQDTAEFSIPWYWWSAGLAGLCLLWLLLKRRS